MVEESVLQRVLNAALRSGGEFAEIYVEDRRNSGARLDDGRIEEFTAGRERGAGIRVVSGNSTGYAHTSDLSERALQEAARAAGAVARGAEGRTTVVALERRSGAPTHPIRKLPETVEKLRKAEVLRRADDAARSAGGAIRQVSAAYADARKRVLIANSEGLLVSDDRVRTRFMVSCTALGDGGLQSGYEGPGRTVGFELFDDFDPEDVARTAAARALRMLDARPAPVGKLPVVLRQGAGGVLFHEACGHGLEADLVSRDASVFQGRLGAQVASPLVTLVDDGTFDRGWGTLSVDDEGHAARRNVLIEGGVLADYMWDFLRARKDGRESSGNGRRETYQSLPMVRMTNTYLLAGHDDPDDIIASTPYGLYCAALGGGQVNTATGDFVFGVTEAYLIENGRLTAPVRAANLIGNGPETLLGIDAVGTDFDTWAGTCGKDGQGVPVSAGQPTVRVAEMTVGGTAGALENADTNGEALMALVRKIAGEAKPGEQVEAYAAVGKGIEVKVFGGEVESLSSENVDGVGVRVVVDGRQGFAWAGSLAPDVVAETLADARDNAAFGTPDEFLGLPGPDEAADTAVDRAALDMWRDGLLATPADDKVALALELERAVMAADPRIRGVRTVSYGDGASVMALANSLGVEATARRTVCSVSALTLAGEGVGTRTGYGFSVGREPSELDLDEAASMAAERAVRLLGATQPKSRRLPVVFDPLVASSILGMISGALNGESVLKGRSMFSTRLGEMVAGQGISIVEDPTNPEAFGAAGYDSEGVPTRPVRMIENGKLCRFLHNVHSGRRSGTGTTGSAVRAGYTSTPGVGTRALHFEPGSAPPEELLRRAEGGLFVQSVTGLHSGASPVTGDFSVGADGLVIRDGALAEPVREVTVASTFQRMLLDLEVGNDLQWLAGGAAAITILVPDMTMSGG